MKKNNWCSDGLDSESKCQLAAEAFALKIMGRERYQRVKTIAENLKTNEVNALISKLNKINEAYTDE